MACENCPLQHARDQLTDRNNCLEKVFASLSALTAWDAMRVWPLVFSDSGDPSFEINDEKCNTPRETLFGKFACEGKLGQVTSSNTERLS